MALAEDVAIGCNLHGFERWVVIVTKILLPCPRVSLIRTPTQQRTCLCRFFYGLS
jgi:hypothetical protein